jgi:hypothetical protein
MKGGAIIVESIHCGCGKTIYYEEDSGIAYCKSCGAIIEFV